MKLSDVLSEKGSRVFTALDTDPVLFAVETLVSHNIGALAILDAGSGYAASSRNGIFCGWCRSRRAS
ncbi:MAG: hypothetical protein IPG71_02310 [bacterium]|nr:hypothetical protein [bacterium]